jgi:hypothetical protein
MSTIKTKIFEIYTLDITGCSQEDKEEIGDYTFCFVNLNSNWFSFCFGGFAPSSNPFKNKGIVTGAKVVKASGEFYKIAKQSFEQEISFNGSIKASL